MPKIRTTMRPDVELDVTDEEAADLAAQGVLAPAETAGDGTKTPAAAGNTPDTKKES